MVELKARGFLLKSIQTQESDVIVKILSQNGEKITAYGRSAKKSKRRFEGGLEVFSQVEFRVVKKNETSLAVLEDTKIIYEFKNLPQSIETFTMASYFAELSEACAQEGLPNPELYNLLGNALKALDMGGSPWLLSSPFEVKLLSLMGWLPDFSQMDEGKAAILREMLKRKISDSILNIAQASQVDGLLKGFIRQHLGDKKMKSLDFFRSMRRFQEQNMMFNPKDPSN